MTWTINWSNRAIKSLRRIQPSDAKRIAAKLAEAATDPSRYLTRLVGQDEFRLRVGDHRVLVLLDHENLVILVEDLGHRRNVYGGEA